MRSASRMAALFIASVALVALSGAAATPSQAGTSWNLVTDLLRPSNQIAFNQGAKGVWYFLESSSLSHDVLSYRFLPDYDAPCLVTPPPGPVGLACWRRMDVGNNLLPLVGINFTDTTLYPHPDLPIPSRTVWMHPLFNKLAIIGWKSPVTGNVTIRGSLSDIQTGCGNGVTWSMDKGDKSLLSGEIASGGEDAFDVSTLVKMGQVLYLLIDPKAGNDCGDSTAVTLTITAD